MKNENDRKQRSVAEVYPHLLAEWSDRNEDLEPENVTRHSPRGVWSAVMDTRHSKCLNKY